MAATLIFLVGVAIVLGVLVARFFPDAVMAVLQWFNRVKYALLVLIGIASALYFLSSGVVWLMLIGFLGVMVGVWQFMFNDPLGWIRPLLPL